MMNFEVGDFLTIGTMLITGAAMFAKLQSSAANSRNQHADLKKSTENQFTALGKRFDDLSQNLSAVAGDSREHGARIANVEKRIDRAEQHIDAIGRNVGIGRGA